MVSRHYAESTSWDVLRPRTDIIDKRSNVIAAEFPAFNLIHASISKVFGYRHWYGRLVNLLLSSIAIWCFYLFLLRFLKDEQAKTAALFMITSLFFSFGRKLMPDVWSVSLVLIGIYLITEWVIRFKSHLSLLALGIFFVSTGVLSKLPAALVLVLLLLPIFTYRHLTSKWMIVMIGLVIGLIPSWWWYFNWTTLLVQEGAFQLFFPYSFKEGLNVFIPLWKGALEKIYFSALQSFSGFIFFLIGMYVIFRQKENLYLGVVFSGLLLLIGFAIKTGEVFPTHNYYVIPFVPVMVMIAAIGVHLIPVSSWRTGMIVLVMAEGLLNQAYDFIIPEERKHLTSIHEMTKEYIPQGDTIAVYSEGSPVLAYYLHYPCVRFGELELKGQPPLHEEHLSHIVALKADLSDTLPYPVVYENDWMVIGKMK